MSQTTALGFSPNSLYKWKPSLSSRNDLSGHWTSFGFQLVVADQKNISTSEATWLSTFSAAVIEYYRPSEDQKSTELTAVESWNLGSSRSTICLVMALLLHHHMTKGICTVRQCSYENSGLSTCSWEATHAITVAFTSWSHLILMTSQGHHLQIPLTHMMLEIKFKHSDHSSTFPDGFPVILFLNYKNKLASGSDISMS